ncbi:venom dipeptidyl peptidase 4-like isoform X2 [Nilaparvata lugens]|uniref:venom dipeptidyl peptidase 4-like isoform X2 n=1 Tax=Nilaparvata lugens TaxID=108931 RepID=UPI00193CF99D|nr:venom dipeptidyl peptidase 4-like isoform X2 [Nilaparvata lugens]
MMNLLGFLTFWIVSTELSMVNAKNLLKLSDMINSPFSGDSYNGYWKSDVELGKFLKGNSVETYNVVTKKKGTALEGSYYVYANSHLCITTVIEMKSGVQHILAGGEPVQIARFVTKSNAVIYVFKNDIYYTEPPYSPNTVVRLTLNGVPGVIFNGVCDWAYEDRIYKKTKAFYFSSDGAFMSYLSFDDSKLPTEHYSSYSAFLSTTTYQYAHDVATRMPKPGTPIPVASVHIICLKTKKEIVIDGLQPPVDLVTKENIAVQLDWADEKNVVVAWANRIQNYVVTNMCDVTTSKCQKILETKQTNGWIQYPTYYFKTASYFAIILPQPQGKAGTYQHLTIVENGVQKPLTSGLRTVDSIVEYDTEHSLIYYLATNLTNVNSLHLYVIKDDGSQPEKCLSCDICPASVEASMSTNNSYFILNCKGPGPATYNVYSNTGEFVMELINNTETKEMLQQLLLPTSYKYEITLADGVSNASVYLKLPPNFDETKKYPFMLNIWGFPDDKQVKDEYSPPDICDYLATAMDVVVVSIDVRGSSGRGDSYTFSIYKKAGQVEVEDHIFVTKALMKKHSYIDPQRIAVFGIGYGGWIATMILARDTENIFKCGIAMNPITNFMYFDAFYTGKLLGLLADNPAGYNYTDVTQLYEGFRGKKYLLMAGTLAAESLYLHSAALARSLQMNLVPFRFMPFIEEDFPDADWTIVNNAIFLVMEVVQFLSEFYGVEPKSKA